MTPQGAALRTRYEEGRLIPDLLLRLVSVAVQLHALGTQAQHALGETPPLDDELERLSNKFDRLHTEALNHGIPINTRFELDLDHIRYHVLLTEDALEYQPLQ